MSAGYVPESWENVIITLVI